MPEEFNERSTIDLAGLNVLLASAFFESRMPSLREFQYSRALAEAGANVTLFTSTGSNVWRFNRAGIKPTDPTLSDADFVSRFNVSLIRRRAWLRISDFFVIWPSFRAIWKADVIHVIEFRQGFTVLVAILGKIMGKLVIYDHEQRGDRKYSILHRLDSFFRRLLIFVGSFFVDRVRHTVVQNGDFFQRIAIRKVPMTLAPLGGDETVFYFDPNIRSQMRSELGFTAFSRVVVFSGKMTAAKRPVDAIKACIKAGWQVVVVGRIEVGLRTQIRSLGDGAVTIVDWADGTELNKYYNAADLVIFTAFSVSYWEAAMTGVEVMVPRSRFSELYVGGDPNFHLFGSADMFALEDEEIRSDFDLHDEIVNALEGVPPSPVAAREASKRYSWAEKRRDLIMFYHDAMREKDII